MLLGKIDAQASVHRWPLLSRALNDEYSFVIDKISFIAPAQIIVPL